MILTNKQEEALKIAIEKFRNRDRFVVISGYAGSGKTTLVKFIISALEQYGIDPEEDVCFATFTGKAAQVLLKKGNRNVSTLHKLLYESIPKPDGTFFRKKKEFIGYKIIVVDEVSMAPKELMDLLFSHSVFVICLGDPFQLPPVDKDSDNHLLDHPDIFLDEIMRQAKESEIIRLSMDIREQKPLDNYSGSDIMVLSKNALNTGMLQWADQILVGTNATRVAINNQMRELLGRQELPEDGDKVICLRNYWDNIADNEDPLVNGTIGYLKNCFETYYKYPRYICDKTVQLLNADFISDSNADFGSLDMDKQMILTGEPSLTWKESYKIGKNPRTKNMLPYQFTYGYAITTHKSQGSSWPKVLVIEERFPFDKTEHARWLYTAVTRSEEKLVLVR